MACLLLMCVTAWAQVSVEVSPEVSTVAPGSTVTVNITIRNVADLHMAIVAVTFDKSTLQ